MPRSSIAVRVALVRLSQWLEEPRNASRVWLGKSSVLAAWAGLLLAVLTPPGGLGIPLCWLHGATGLPCLGCGLTRSLSCGLRGLFLQSWHYHPMGLTILALFFVIAAQSICPKSLREAVARTIQSRAVLFTSLYLAFVATFVGFGVTRALVQFAVAGSAAGHP